MSTLTSYWGMFLGCDLSDFSVILFSEIIKCLLAQCWPTETSAPLGLGVGTTKGLFPRGGQCSAVFWQRKRDAGNVT